MRARISRCKHSGWMLFALNEGSRVRFPGGAPFLDGGSTTDGVLDRETCLTADFLRTSRRSMRIRLPCPKKFMHPGRVVRTFSHRCPSCYGSKPPRQRGRPSSILGGHSSSPSSSNGRIFPSEGKDRGSIPRDGAIKRHVSMAERRSHKPHIRVRFPVSLPCPKPFVQWSGPRAYLSQMGVRFPHGLPSARLVTMAARLFRTQEVEVRLLR